MKQKYGYVRVSSKDQNIDRQMAAMNMAGISVRKIFVDKLSGKDFNRPKYQKLVRRLKFGDELYIKSIDRLGRNYDEIIEQWHYLTRKKDIDIIVLDFPLLDTRNQINGITGKFIADLVLQILSYVAQIERENIHQRQMEGIKEAKKRGVHFGRPKQPLPDNFYEIAAAWQMSKISKREAARRLNISHTTFSRWLDYYLSNDAKTL
ncbi:recombinase family protein [Beduini massiliensis]|uniref:recombinase family protein n=1 Tax=Beduini massiliensis TaxID=1585974 RepID=UPI00059AB59F|nr:recombinase family protein [Beduini massiliensis]